MIAQISVLEFKKTLLTAGQDCSQQTTELQKTVIQRCMTSHRLHHKKNFFAKTGEFRAVGAFELILAWSRDQLS